VLEAIQAGGKYLMAIYMVTWTFAVGEGEVIGYCEAKSKEEAADIYAYGDPDADCEFYVRAENIAGSAKFQDWWGDRSSDYDDIVITGWKSLKEVEAELTAIAARHFQFPFRKHNY
jgi:hypothetical protein